MSGAFAEADDLINELDRPSEYEIISLANGDDM